MPTSTHQVDTYNYSRVPVDTYVSGLAFFFGFAVFGIQGILFGPLLLCLGSFAYEAIGWLADDFKGEDEDEDESKSTQKSSTTMSRLRRVSRRFISPLTFPIDEEDQDDDEKRVVLDVKVKNVPGLEDGNHRIRIAKKKASCSLKRQVLDALYEEEEEAGSSSSVHHQHYKLCTDTGDIVHDVRLIKSSEALLLTYSRVREV